MKTVRYHVGSILPGGTLGFLCLNPKDKTSYFSENSESKDIRVWEYPGDALVMAGRTDFVLVSFDAKF